MYTLRDTHNQRDLSRHHTLDAAARARRDHGAAVRGHHGATSYIPMSLIDAAGRVIDTRHPEYDAWSDAQDRVQLGECS